MRRVDTMMACGFVLGRRAPNVTAAAPRGAQPMSTKLLRRALGSLQQPGTAGTVTSGAAPGEPGTVGPATKTKASRIALKRDAAKAKKRLARAHKAAQEPQRTAQRNLAYFSASSTAKPGTTDIMKQVGPCRQAGRGCTRGRAHGRACEHARACERARVPARCGSCSLHLHRC